MQRQPVQSSTIIAVGYDPDTRTLEVAFKSGGAYRYADVPPEAHSDLMAAESVGKHFHAKIRGAFTHALIPDDEGDKAENGGSEQ